MNRLSANLRFLIDLQKINWKSFLTYRLQAAVWMLGEAITILYSIVAITVVYTISNGIFGWSYFQVLALAGITNMIFSLSAYMIVPHEIISRLRDGKIDMWFTKPYSYLIILSGAFGSPTALAGFVSGLGLLVYSVIQLHVQAIKLLYFIPTFIAGTAAFIMFILMITVVSYILFKSGDFIDDMKNMLGGLGQYPLSVYGILGQLIFTILIPIGIAYYYPAEVLFGFVGIEGTIAELLLSIVIILVSRKIIYEVLKGYSSGGG